MIVGAHALAANGRPRATQDIDFWIEAEFGEHRVPFLGRRHLIENKLATGRTKDRLDVELLNEGTSAD